MAAKKTGAHCQYCNADFGSARKKGTHVTKSLDCRQRLRDDIFKRLAKGDMTRVGISTELDCSESMVHRCIMDLKGKGVKWQSPIVAGQYHCRYCGGDYKSVASYSTHFRLTQLCWDLLDGDIMKLLAKGKSYRAVAAEIGCSPDTVANHAQVAKLHSPGPVHPKRKVGTRPKEAQAPAPVDEPSLGQQVLDAAYAYKDRALQAEGKLVDLQETIQELKNKVSSLQGYKEKYDEKVQELARAKAFAASGEGGLGGRG